MTQQPTLREILEGSISDEKELFKYLFGPSSAGGHEAPHIFLEMAFSVEGPRINMFEFWPLVARFWSSFDRVPHDQFAHAFEAFEGFYGDIEDLLFTEADRTFYNALEPQFEAYRGFDFDTGSPIGLSWTTDRKVAEGFARGHRGRNAKKPTIATREIRRHEIAFVSTDREELEIVLWELPADRSIKLTSIELDNATAA